MLYDKIYEIPQALNSIGTLEIINKASVGKERPIMTSMRLSRRQGSLHTVMNHPGASPSMNTVNASLGQP